MIDLSEPDQNMLLGALRAGEGLTKACYGLNWNIIDISTYLKQSPEFYKKCQFIASSSYRMVLADINKAISRKSMHQAQAAKSQTMAFISHVTLWESTCKKKDFNIDLLEEILPLMQSVREAATATGHLLPEMFKIVYGDEDIRRFVKMYRYI